jgi:hypothetical protein
MINQSAGDGIIVSPCRVRVRGYMNQFYCTVCALGSGVYHVCFKLDNLEQGGHMTYEISDSQRSHADLIFFLNM